MTTAIPESTEVSDRLERLEGEIAELRHTLSELAEIIVGDIRDRRDAADAVAAAPAEIPVPAALVPGGQATLNAVNAVRRPWLVIDLLREIGTMIRMYMHPRYRVRRSTQLTVMLLVGLFVANYLVFNVLFLHIPIVSEVVALLVDIILAVLLYKVLSREVARFRQVVAQLMVGSRSWVGTPSSLLNNDPETAAVTREESP